MPEFFPLHFSKVILRIIQWLEFTSVEAELPPGIDADVGLSPGCELFLQDLYKLPAHILLSSRSPAWQAGLCPLTSILLVSGLSRLAAMRRDGEALITPRTNRTNQKLFLLNCIQVNTFTYVFN